MYLEVYFAGAVSEQIPSPCGAAALLRTSALLKWTYAFLERRYPNKKCKFKINYMCVCCVLYIVNVHCLSDRMLRVALYFVPAADEY